MSNYSTLNEFIQSGDSDLINYHNLSLVETIGDIECPYDNVVYDYLDELMAISETVQLTDSERNSYKYRPDLLSYDIYGTTKYDFIILAINNIEQDKYFDTNILNLITKDNMEIIMEYIYNAENDYILSNRMKTDSSVIDDKNYEL